MSKEFKFKDYTDIDSYFDDTSIYESYAGLLDEKGKPLNLKFDISKGKAKEREERIFYNLPAGALFPDKDD